MPVASLFIIYYLSIELILFIRFMFFVRIKFSKSRSVSFEFYQKKKKRTKKLKQKIQFAEVKKKGEIAKKGIHSHSGQAYDNNIKYKNVMPVEKREYRNKANQINN